VRAGQLRLEEALFVVATAIDFVVHVARDVEGTRRVASVREISAAGSEGLIISSAELYAPGPDGRAGATGVPMSAERMDVLRRTGYRSRR
jgi:hypothetical protein